MPGVVVDTHTIVWYLSADARLSAKAVEALDFATSAAEFAQRTTMHVENVFDGLWSRVEYRQGVEIEAAPSRSRRRARPRSVRGGYT